MSEIKVNKISPRTACGTTTLGDSGDTFTIPSGVSITNQGTASGFGSTGEVSWVTTKKTTTFTVTSGEGYFCDTSSGGFTVNLPAGTPGNSFAVADYTNTFQTGNLTISPNGSQKIGGIAADSILSTEGQSAYFVYVDDTEGWKNVIDSTSNVTGNEFIVATGGTITNCGNCRIHTFTGPGTFTVSQVHPCAANNLVSYTVVGGGGAGSNSNGGGGGAGGYRELVSPSAPYTGSPLNGYPNSPNRITVTATGFPIAVGAGGTAGPNTGTTASVVSGNVSTFSTIIGAAGGGGGSGYGPGPHNPGAAGGSGGGGGTNGGSGAAGNTPPVSPAQGQAGGAATPSSPHLAGGGGGATQAGRDYNASCAGHGGDGATNSITGSAVARAGGGGGGSDPGRSDVPGGTGGGGEGKSNATGIAGTINTGGGGGGGGYRASPPSGTYFAGGNGGSGVVIIRYKFK